MDTPARILIVEDDAAIRRFVRQALAAEGHQVFETDGVKRGLIEAGTRKPDLLILDLGLADGDGMDLIHDLRGWSTVPVIVLSARTTEADKIEALDGGADDYLVKPFSVGELLARVRAALRRRDSAHPQAPGGVAFGECEIDLVKRQVRRRGEHLHLTGVEYKLAAALISREGQVLTHRQLLREVWGPGSVEHSHYLRIYLGHLRRKLEVDPARPAHFLTETGVGYRFVAQPVAPATMLATSGTSAMLATSATSPPATPSVPSTPPAPAP